MDWISSAIFFTVTGSISSVLLERKASPLNFKIIRLYLTDLVIVTPEN